MMADPSTPNSERFSEELRRDPADAHRFAADVIGAAERMGYPKAARFAIRLAFEEAVSNAFKHGSAGIEPDPTVLVEAEVTAREVRMAVEDHGPGFDPAAIADPTLDENLDKPSGRGLMLIRAYMTRVEHNPAGNRIEMVYQRPKA